MRAHLWLNRVTVYLACTDVPGARMKAAPHRATSAMQQKWGDVACLARNELFCGVNGLLDCHANETRELFTPLYTPVFEDDYP